MVEVLPAAVWLHHMQGQPAYACVEAALTLRFAFEQLGIEARVAAVQLRIEDHATGWETDYGRADPFWADRVFHGCVKVNGLHQGRRRWPHLGQPSRRVGGVRRCGHSYLDQAGAVPTDLDETEPLVELLSAGVDREDIEYDGLAARCGLVE